jgi:hypothetical protein
VNYRILTLILLLAALLTATGCVSKSNYQALMADYAELSRQCDELNQQNLNVGAELQVKSTEMEALQENYAGQIEANNALHDQVDQANEQLDKRQAEIKALEQKASVLEYQELEQANQNLEDEVQSLKGDASNLQVQIKKLNDQIAEYDDIELYKSIWSRSVFSGVQPFYQGINLVNNSAATDPSYKQLISFIKADKTDRKDYITDVYMCGDFAEDVHNNAERAGIKAGLVGIQFEEGPGHACNVFKTTDKGLVFIDCTGNMIGEDGPSSCDTKVKIQVGTQYRPKPIVDSGWYWLSMGKVTDVEIYW